MIDLRGKVAVVTGGNRGIGAAIVKVLALYGVEVVINYPPQIEGAESQASELVDTLSAGGHRSMTVAADVTNENEIRAMFKAVEDELGPVDILVNNAGIIKDKPVIKMTLDDWEQVLKVNLTGTFLCSQAAVGSMLKRGGAIVNLASLMAQTGNKGQANYCASKGGIISFTKSLAREYASRNIRVNAVAPGFIETGMTMAIPEEARLKWIEQIPLGRAGSPQEVAKVVAFLASDEASYLTGVIIPIDGGWMMTS